MKLFVTAIGTDSGKTVFSAILAQAFGADYWKPIQAGLPSDMSIVQDLVTNPKSRFFPETYLLQTPASPHASAKIDGLRIEMDQFQIPDYNEHLVIEGAGGVLVPLNDQETVLDMIIALKCQPILVSNLYLGSINHTLLTVELFRSNHIEPLGIVFNGPSNSESENIILNKSGYEVLLRIHPEPAINPRIIQKYANELRSKWQPQAN